MDRFSSMLRVVCTRLCAVLMDHELDARPNKLMLKKKETFITTAHHQSLSGVFTGGRACMHTLPLAQSHPRSPARCRNVGQRGVILLQNWVDSSFFFFTLPSRQTDSNNDRFPWQPHSKVATPVSNSERRGRGDLHEECEQFVSAEVGAVTGTGSNELV